MKIPKDVIEKIDAEVDAYAQVMPETMHFLKHDFYRMAQWGYELAYNEILSSKGFGPKPAPTDPRCQCGHLHSEHHPTNSVNYSAGRCTVGECRCIHFLIGNNGK